MVYCYRAIEFVYFLGRILYYGLVRRRWNDDKILDVMGFFGLMMVI